MTSAQDSDYYVESTEKELQEDLEVYKNQMTKMPEDKKESMSRAKLILDLVNQLRSGKDAWRISLPCQLLTSSSMLEYISFFITPNNFILGAPGKFDGEMRIMSILKWWLSNFSRAPAKGIRHTKPYNPVLGEVFSARFDHKDHGSETFYIAEQVSHHPPISTFFMTNRKQGYSVKATLYPKTKFHGNSTSMVIDGPVEVHLHNHKEVYQVKLPHVVAYGLLYGSQRIEINDKMVITCKQTGYTCTCKFKSKSGNKMTGKVTYNGSKMYKLSGILDGKINIKNCATKKTALFLDASSIPRDDPVCKPLVMQADNESRKIWHKLTVNVKKDRNYSEANKAKNVVEQFQREVAARRKKNGTIWKSKLFDLQPNKSYKCKFETFAAYQKDEKGFEHNHSALRMGEPTKM